MNSVHEVEVWVEEKVEVWVEVEEKVEEPIEVWVEKKA